MNLYRSILFTVCSIMFVFASCGDDYIESGIEGRWQLRQVTSPDGQAATVDTVFYSFKKKVFEYRQLDTPTQPSGCFGTYNLTDDILEIKIDNESYFPDNQEPYLNWDGLTRTYRVLKQTSSKMELEYAGSTFCFRKY